MQLKDCAILTFETRIEETTSMKSNVGFLFFVVF